MSVEVHPYREVSGNVITYNNVDYYLNDIPDVLMLRFDVINEETEKKLIDLINSKSKDDQQRLRSASFCIGNLFSEQLNLNKYFNDYEFGILEPGTGMRFTDTRFEKNNNKKEGIVSVLNMGSDVLFSLRNFVTQKKYDIWLPRRAAFVITDPSYVWQRGIAERSYDELQGKTYNRNKRYSIVFKGKK